MATKTGIPAGAGDERRLHAFQRRDHALQPPPDHARGGHGGAAEDQAGQGAVHRHGRAGRAAGACIWRRRAWAGSGWWISTWWIPRTCSGRCFSARSDVGVPKTEAAADRLRESESGHPDRYVRDAADQRERARDFQGLRHHRRRHGQFSDALSGERRVRAAGQAERVRLDFPVRGADHGVRLSGRALLPLPLSRTASAGAGAFVRRGRRAGRAAGNRGHDPGGGDAEADHRQGRAADRAPAAVRCAGDEIPRAEAAQESGLPGLRRRIRRRRS